MHRLSVNTRRTEFESYCLSINCSTRTTYASNSRQKRGYIYVLRSSWVKPFASSMSARRQGLAGLPPQEAGRRQGLQASRRAHLPAPTRYSTRHSHPQKLAPEPALSCGHLPLAQRHRAVVCWLQQTSSCATSHDRLPTDLLEPVMHLKLAF